jgi:hypothetical protein
VPYNLPFSQRSNVQFAWLLMCHCTL